MNRSRPLWLASELVALAIATPAAAAPADWNSASNVVRDGLVGFSLGVPALKQDWTGVEQEALAMGVAEAVTGALKLTVHEDRPDHSNDRSFPSGHTTISFAAAAGIEQRYGWRYGVPAHLAAAFVGLARVKAEKHYWKDVIVGAAIGEAAGLLLVDKRHKARDVPLGATMTVVF